MKMTKKVLSLVLTIAMMLTLVVQLPAQAALKDGATAKAKLSLVALVPDSKSTGVGKYGYKVVGVNDAGFSTKNANDLIYVGIQASNFKNVKEADNGLGIQYLSLKIEYNDTYLIPGFRTGYAGRLFSTTASHKADSIMDELELETGGYYDYKEEVVNNEAVERTYSLADSTVDTTAHTITFDLKYDPTATELVSATYLPKDGDILLFIPFIMKEKGSDVPYSTKLINYCKTNASNYFALEFGLSNVGKAYQLPSNDMFGDPSVSDADIRHVIEFDEAGVDFRPSPPSRKGIAVEGATVQYTPGEKFKLPTKVTFEMTDKSEGDAVPADKLTYYWGEHNLTVNDVETAGSALTTDSEMTLEMNNKYLYALYKDADTKWIKRVDLLKVAENTLSAVAALGIPTSATTGDAINFGNIKVRRTYSVTGKEGADVLLANASDVALYSVDGTTYTKLAPGATYPATAGKYKYVVGKNVDSGTPGVLATVVEVDVKEPVKDPIPVTAADLAVENAVGTYGSTALESGATVKLVGDKFSGITVTADMVLADNADIGTNQPVKLTNIQFSNPQCTMSATEATVNGATVKPATPVIEIDSKTNKIKVVKAEGDKHTYTYKVNGDAEAVSESNGLVNFDTALGTAYKVVAVCNGVDSAESNEVTTLANAVSLVSTKGGRITVYTDETSISGLAGLKTLFGSAMPSYKEIYVTEADGTKTLVDDTWTGTITAGTEFEISYVPTGGGGSAGGGVSSYSVKFDAGKNGTLANGKTTTSLVATYNKTLEASRIPEVTAKNGYKFKGWSLDGETVVDPTAEAVKKSLTYKAVYEEETTATPKPVATPKPSDKPIIDVTYNKPYVGGYEDGTFRPDAQITRAELATMMARLCNGTDIAAGSYYSSFPDVERDAWYSRYIGYLEDYNVLTGYEDGTFHPYDIVTRSEICAVIARAQKYDLVSGANFTDIDDAGWAELYIATLANKGIVEGYPDGSFGVGSLVTRGEAVAMINRVLAKSTPVIKTTFPDIASHWAKNDIILASNEREVEVVVTPAPQATEEPEEDEAEATAAPDEADEAEATEAPEAE